jgi:cytochrome c-type biogenesis protein CcmH/NrfF
VTAARRLARVTLVLASAITASIPARALGAQHASPPPVVPETTTAMRDSIRADSVLGARTTALAVQIRCAVCQGISIQDSPSALAREMREVVRDQLRAGRTEEEVKAYFVSKYGEWILLEPPAHGLNLAIYLLPVLLVVGGAAGLVVVVRRWTGKAPS